MNQNIEKLYQIAQQKERIIIGLMSGTSLDGLDIALCKLTGSGTETKIELLFFETVTYNSFLKTEVQSIFSKKNVDLEKLCILNSWIAIQHAEMILNCLNKWNKKPNEIDLIASHGQTIYHAPKNLHQQSAFGNATLQIGDGDHIAVKTGIITISDFRQKHIAAGGEGAPLAVYGDFLIFSSTTENRIMLNIGGIANFTYLPSSKNIQEVFSTDVGPGNTLMDAYMKKYFSLDYDKNSEVAKKGTVNIDLLKALQQNSFFEKDFPKTTGPELFNLSYLTTTQGNSNTSSISHEDCMATLNKFTANMIVDAIRRTTNKDESYVLYMSGGGIHNPLLKENIQHQLPNCTFKTTNDLNILADAKEAVLFAILANECVSENTLNFTENTKSGIPSVSLGKISFPN